MLRKKLDIILDTLFLVFKKKVDLLNITTIPWMYILGWQLSLICFIIGFYKTGRGLSEFQIFGSANGSFFLSFLIFTVLLIAYKSAIDGSEIGLTVFVIFALVNVVCHFNYSYPIYMADSLIRTEIANDKKSFTQLSEEIRANFVDNKFDEFAKNIGDKSIQLQAEIIHGGLGAKAEKDLQGIESLLGIQITRIKSGSNQQAWGKIADEYGRLIHDALNVKLIENDYGSKHNLIRDAEKWQELLFLKLDKLADSPVKILAVPVEINELVSKYRDLCVRATRLSNANSISCDSSFQSENADLRKFSHIFRSAMHHLYEADTWINLLASLGINLGIPLIVYFVLLKNSDNYKGENRRLQTVSDQIASWELRSSLWGCLMIIFPVMVYYYTAPILHFEPNPAALFVGLSIGVVLLTDYALLKIRVVRGYYGSNALEAMEIVRFLHKKRDSGDSGSMRKILPTKTAVSVENYVSESGNVADIDRG